MILLPPAGAVAQYDPSTEWRTVVAPHFQVHYPAGRYELALDVARASESALAELSDRLGWMPETPVHVVLNDETDSANGFAQSIPYNLIGLNAAAPDEVGDLSFYDDWVWGLVVHELAHIVHIDTVLGIPSIVNAVFGRWLTPNGAQPRWLVEGLATYFESALSGSGRVRSAHFDMYMRMALLDGGELKIDEMTGFPWKWPQGSIPYLYGGRFIDYLVRRFGEDVLREISHDYGARIVPFAVNASVEEATGEVYPRLYEDFLGELRQRYRAQRDEVERLGRREGVRLTDHGQQIGRPRVAGDDTIYFVESPLGAHSNVVALAPDGSERHVARVYSGAELALLPGGDQAIVTQLEIHDVYRVYGDLFRLDLESGELERLTAGARAQSVDASPTDGRIVFVQNDGVHSLLRLASLDDLEGATVLADLGPRAQIWSPRFSPDGRQVVFAGFADGCRDIYVVDVSSGEVRALTSDRAVDGGPSFSVDGTTVYFHSDRDGIYNIYSVPVAGGQLRRVTRVIGGAFAPEPMPGGEALVYRSYGVKGFDLARIGLVPPADDAQVPETAPNVHGQPVVRTRTDVYPSREYTAASTILPRAWLPELTVDTRGTTVGAAVFGGDAVGLHSYLLSVWYGLSSEFAGFSASYVNSQFHPGFYLQLDRHLGYALIPYLRNERLFGVEEEIWSGTVGTTWPLIKELERSLSLTTSYAMTVRKGTQALRLDPLDTTPRFPDQGRFGALRVGFVFSDVRTYTGSISAEEGTRLEVNLRLEDPYLGSEYSAVSGTARATQYFRVPFHRRHVLALDLRGGFGKSSYARRRLYGVSGLPRSDILLDILGSRVSTLGGLRGFPVSPSFVGNAMLVGHAEYRLPFHDFESGVETLPIYVRALHAALFVDGAAVADSPSELPDNRHFSVGMELRLGIVLAYAIGTTLRLGYGHGLGRDDVQNVYLVLGGGY